MISIYYKFCIVSQQRSYLLDQMYRILFFTTFTNYDVNMTTASCQLTLQFLTMFNRAVQRTTARPASPSRRCHSPPHRNFRYHRPYHRRDQQRAPTRLHSSAHPPAPRLWRWSRQNPRQVDRTFLDSSMSLGLKGHIGILIIHQDSYCTWKGEKSRWTCRDKQIRNKRSLRVLSKIVTWRMNLISQTCFTAHGILSRQRDKFGYFFWLAPRQ